MLMRPIPEISVVILCYKAGDFVPVFVEKVKKVLEDKNLDYELVLVANFNSKERLSDPTPAIVKNLAATDSRITPVIKEKKGMMGWDMQSGLEAARGKTVAVIDGDGQMPPEDAYTVYQALCSGNFDMAKTYRIKRGDGWIRLLVSKIYNFFLKLLFFRVKVKDANSKPKIFTREALQRMRLSSNDWFIDAEIIIQASHLGFRIIEVPAVFHPNPLRTSFIDAAAVFKFVITLLKYRVKTLWRRPW